MLLSPHFRCATSPHHCRPHQNASGNGVVRPKPNADHSVKHIQRCQGGACSLLREDSLHPSQTCPRLAAQPQRSCSKAVAGCSQRRGLVQHHVRCPWYSERTGQRAHLPRGLALTMPFPHSFLCAGVLFVARLVRWQLTGSRVGLPAMQRNPALGFLRRVTARQRTPSSVPWPHLSRRHHPFQPQGGLAGGVQDHPRPGGPGVCGPGGAAGGGIPRQGGAGGLAPGWGAPARVPAKGWLTLCVLGQAFYAVVCACRQ